MISNIENDPHFQTIDQIQGSSNFFSSHDLQYKKNINKEIYEEPGADKKYDGIYLKYRKIEEEFSIYKRIYKIPTIKTIIKHQTHQEKRLSPYLLKLCFYNRNGEILLRNGLNLAVSKQEKTDYQWILPFTAIKFDESIFDSIKRIAGTITDSKINGTYPVCFVDSSYELNGKIIIQKQIVLMVPWERNIDPTTKNKLKWLKPLTDDLKSLKVCLTDKKILDLGFLKISSLSRPPIKEIESHRKARIRYLIHEALISKIFHPLCSKILQNQIISKISSQFKSNSELTILDLACGDDKLLINIADRYKKGIFIGNDISREKLEAIKSYDRNHRCIFTNHDLNNFYGLLSGKKRNGSKNFDVILLKNTIHHLEKHSLINLIRESQKLAKMVIIVDIEDPLHSNFWAKLWNFYYTHFLSDAGSKFLTFKTFNKIIKENSKIGSKISFNSVHTIKGNYMMAIISENNNQFKGE